MFAVRLSNQTRNATVGNLKSFGRYIAAIVACQDFGKELENYAKRFSRELKTSVFAEYLNAFPVDVHCSKPDIEFFRSLPDGMCTR